MTEDCTLSTLSGVRYKYFEMRWEVRKRIIVKLKESDHKITNEGPKEFKKACVENTNLHDRQGHGLFDYSNNSKIAPFDLTGWQFITVNNNGLKLNIDLQSFDRDTKYDHYHVLFDRIQFRCDDPEIYVITKFNVYSDEFDKALPDLVEQFGEFCDFAATLSNEQKAASGMKNDYLSKSQEKKWYWRILLGNPWQ